MKLIYILDLLSIYFFSSLQYVHDYTMFTTLSFIIRGAEALGSSSFFTASYVLIVEIFPENAGTARVSKFTIEILL